MLLGSSDEQLVDFVLDGDDEAFEVLFDRHVADAIWFARDVLGSWGEAEEAVRHSFAAAHAYLASRDREIEFAPWLHTILSNHCLSMLQARGPSAGETAAVVDLDEWRRGRKRLGVAAPVAASAGLRESVMAACGVGTGATAASAPLLGGTVAKLAVVALLAGGAGVAGQAAPEQRTPAGGGTEELQAAGGETAVPAFAGDLASSAPAQQPASHSTGSDLRGKRATPLSARPPPAPGARTPSDPRQPEAPSAHDETASNDSPGASGSPSPAETVNNAPTAVESPVRTPVQRVTDTVKARAPALTGALPKVSLPPPVDLPAIGNDLQVTTGKLTADGLGLPVVFMTPRPAR